MNPHVPATIRCLLALLCVTGLATRAVLLADEPVASPRPDVNPRVLAFLKPVEVAETDDELTRKLKERHNVATGLLESRIHEYRKGVCNLSQILEAARLAAEAKFDLAQDDAARLSALNDTLEIAKISEDFQRVSYEAGVGSKSDFQRAQLARLNVEVQILKIKAAVPGRN